MAGEPRSARAYIRAASAINWRSTPETDSAYSGVYFSSDAAYSSKPSVRSRTKAWLYSFSFTMTCAMALNSGTLVPGCRGSHSAA